MRIAQLLPTLNVGDAVGNNCRAIDSILCEAGYDARIYAENIDARLPKGTVDHISKLVRLGPHDILLYHMAIAFNHDLTQFGGRRIFQYHNVTPPEFYEKYDDFISKAKKMFSDFSELDSAVISVISCDDESVISEKVLDF